MEGNYYKERNVMEKLPIILLISIGTLLLAILAFFLFHWFNKEKKFDIETDFLEVGKNYYSSYSNSLPNYAGECTSITLETMLAKGLIEDTEKYSSCNKYDTRMKACKLESNQYHYVPILVCDSVNTEAQFSEWTVGTEKNLIADSSDVEFSFLGYKQLTNQSSEILEKWEDEITAKDYKVIEKTTYYRYRDKEWLWQETSNEYFTNNDVGNDILAYYATSPREDYPNSDSQTTAYKWYIEQNVATSPKKMYICKNPIGSATSYKNAPCSEAIDGKTETVKEFYTCGVLLQDETGKKYYPEVSENTLCDCSSDIYGNNCSVKKAYYPSGEEVANKENVYYAISPMAGAIKDVATELNVSRYYKEVITTTSKYYSTRPSDTAIKVENGRWGSWTEYKTSKPKEYSTRQIETRNKIKYQLVESDEPEWTKISNDYLSLDEFIKELKALDYNINSINDINKNVELKYEMQLKYRNKNN